MSTPTGQTALAADDVATADLAVRDADGLAQQTKIDAAIAYITSAMHKLERTGLATIVAVGTYVADCLGVDSVSYRRLADDPRLGELGLGKSTLNNWCRVAALYNAYPESVRDGLSPTAHVRLLSAPDGARVDLATRAANQGWTVYRLADEVGAARARDAELRKREADAAGKGLSGRPPLPVALKRVRSLQRVAEALTVELDWHQLDESQIADATETLDRIAHRLDSARQMLAQARNPDQ